MSRRMDGWNERWMNGWMGDGVSVDHVLVLLLDIRG